MINKRLSYFTLCIFLVCLCFVSCGSAKIPEIANVDEMSAKNLLSSNGIIPAVVYEYNNEVAVGCVIRTEPMIGSSVSKNSVVTIYISKGTELTVPDVVNVDEETAKKVLTSLQLIPSISYEYSDTIIAGNVIRTDPAIGTVVNNNSKITVYLSYGPSRVDAKHVDVDIWDFMESCSVYREEDNLYIECQNCAVSYYKETSWYDPNDTGYIQAVASLTEDFYKYISVKGKYQQKVWYYGDYGPGRQTFTLEIPLIELCVEKPTTVYVSLYYITPWNSGSYEEKAPESVTFGLNISW